MNNNNINNNDTNTNNIIAPPHHALLPAGQKLLAILQQKSELPPYVDSKINEELNAMAEEFLTKIRSSVVDLFFEDDLGDEELELKRREQQLQKNKSIITVVDKDWYNVEKKFEKAIRFFPDILRDRRYENYPLQWMTSFRGCRMYNLQFISLIPLLVRLGIELQQFDEALRGGLLLQNVDEEGQVLHYLTVLHFIVQYRRMKDEENNKLVDEVFFSVWKQLRETNIFRKEDIKQLKLMLFYFHPPTEDVGCIFSVRKFRYLVDWDPTVLCVPLWHEDGNWLPIHFCADNEYRTVDHFIEIVRAGLQYHPEKLGHIFTTGTQRFELESDNNDDDDDDDSVEEIKYKTKVGTPFEFACELHGQPKVVEAVLNCFAEYCDSSGTSNTTDTGNNTTDNDHTMTHAATEFSLLLSTVTDQSIHLDGLYILLRKNPVDALLKLHQHLSLPNHRDPGRSPIKTNNETNVDPDITEFKTNQIDNDARKIGTETGEKKRKYEAIGSSDL